MNRTICVLANSIKFGGRCIAGKEALLSPDRTLWRVTNNWLRPLGAAPRGELTFQEYAVGNRAPKLLELVEIPFNAPREVPGQPEDWGIIANTAWQVVSTLDPAHIRAICDHPESLWLEQFCKSDRVSTNYLTTNRSPSLQLIEATNLTLHIESTRDFHTGSIVLKRRCRFDYAGQTYDLALTDPVMQNIYFPRFPAVIPGEVNPGPDRNSVVCVSLSPALNGLHYKLVAAVFN